MACLRLSIGSLRRRDVSLRRRGGRVVRENHSVDKERNEEWQSFSHASAAVVRPHALRSGLELAGEEGPEKGPRDEAEADVARRCM